MSSSLEDLLTRLQREGYEVKREKVYLYQSAKPGAVHSAQKPGHRLRRRGRCIPHCQRPQALQTAPAAQRKVSLLIEIQNNIRAQQSAGYQLWATIENLKRAAATMNFLTEHGIGSYEKLVERCDAVAAAAIRTRKSPRDTEQRITALALLGRQIETCL